MRGSWGENGGPPDPDREEKRNNRKKQEAANLGGQKKKALQLKIAKKKVPTQMKQPHLCKGEKWPVIGVFRDEPKKTTVPKN